MATFIIPDNRKISKKNHSNSFIENTDLVFPSLKETNEASIHITPDFKKGSKIERKYMKDGVHIISSPLNFVSIGASEGNSDFLLFHPELSSKKDFSFVTPKNNYVPTLISFVEDICNYEKKLFKEKSKDALIQLYQHIESTRIRVMDFPPFKIVSDFLYNSFFNEFCQLQTDVGNLRKAITLAESSVLNHISNGLISILASKTHNHDCIVTFIKGYASILSNDAFLSILESIMNLESSNNKDSEVFMILRQTITDFSKFYSNNQEIIKTRQYNEMKQTLKQRIEMKGSIEKVQSRFTSLKYFVSISNSNRILKTGDFVTSSDRNQMLLEKEISLLCEHYSYVVYENKRISVLYQKKYPVIRALIKFIIPPHYPWCILSTELEVVIGNPEKTNKLVLSVIGKQRFRKFPILSFMIDLHKEIN